MIGVNVETSIQNSRDRSAIIFLFFSHSVLLLACLFFAGLGELKIAKCHNGLTSNFRFIFTTSFSLETPLHSADNAIETITSYQKVITTSAVP